jgi:cobalt-zinc-cadmium efflux system outer membrane protein
MLLKRLLFLSLLLLNGCTWPVREETDRTLREMASQPFDLAPPETASGTPTAATPAGGGKADSFTGATDLRTVALMEAEQAPEKPGRGLPQYKLQIPTEIPGAEAAPVDFFKRDKQGKILREREGKPVEMSREEKQEVIKKLYPQLPELPQEPIAQAGPQGRPYTLSDLQRLAAQNSPTLRQAIADVQNAEGALYQAKTYQNPYVGYQQTPANNNSNAGAPGLFAQQHITMFGKMKMNIAIAQKSLDNSRLALRRARSDLSTNVRNAYFALLVAQETLRVNRALARFTDEIYRLYTGYLASGVVAPYEPAPLRAQAYTTRLAYQQAITGYIYAWKQLVATLGLTQLPLTQVAGRIDRLIPYYDYDAILAHVLANHTDVLTARNGVEQARYNLKLAQITPYPDMDVWGGFYKESTLPPFTYFYQAQVSFPIPLWDQNKGNIVSAQAALIRAEAESHRVENALTNTLAANYTNYQNNLNALEYYRRHILPDQVRYYRGVFDRRERDINASPSDLVTAQQALASNVQTYLGILGSLWSGVVSVADLLQTDDLFQLAQPRELPPLPDFNTLPRQFGPNQRPPSAAPTPALPPAGDNVLPAPRPLPPAKVPQAAGSRSSTPLANAP